MYTHKLYAFQTENAGIEPLKLQEICERDVEQNDDDEQSVASDDKQNDLIFDHEWIHQKVFFFLFHLKSIKKTLFHINVLYKIIFHLQQYTLYPDKAAIIIIKMEMSDFEVASNGCDYDIFLMYNVFLESGLWKEFQTHIATVNIDSDIFHDKRYFVSFDSNNSTNKQLYSIEKKSH